MSSFGLIEKNIELSHIYLAVPDSVNKAVSRLINLGKRHIHQDELAN